MTLGDLCDKKVPLKLKGKFYHIVVISAMLHDRECWAIKNQDNDRISIAKMRILHRICGKTR
jgi:hypothetical protein